MGRLGLQIIQVQRLRVRAVRLNSLACLVTMCIGCGRKVHVLCHVGRVVSCVGSHVLIENVFGRFFVLGFKQNVLLSCVSCVQLTGVCATLLVILPLLIRK